MKKRKCSNCRKEKSLDSKNFPVNKRYKEGFGTWCKECHGTASTAWTRKQAKKDPDFYKNRALEKHRTTIEWFEAKLKEQHGHCALCSATTSEGQRLSVDHDHKICPGKYACDECRRGLLCNACNIRLGFLEATLVEAIVTPFPQLIGKPEPWTNRALRYLASYKGAR